MIVRTANNPLRPCAPSCLAASLTAAILALAGCSSGLAPATPAANTLLTGRVMGGQQPVSGATITLWQVNTNGNAATSMLKTAVTTNSTGGFSITNDYPNSSTTCTASTQVYILATGGNPGLTSGTNNAAIALMAALGPCLTLQQNAATSYLTIDEVTTVAAAFALQQFIGVSEGTAGAEDIAVNSANSLSAQSAVGMVNAFATAANLASNSTGTANATVGNATLEASKLNSIANILSPCVNSTGPTSTTCQALFNAVTPAGSLSPGDTLQAALYLAQNPGTNVATLFALQPTTPPFQPSLSTAPFDFSLAITYTSNGLNLPNLLASDASGNIWITDSASSGAEALVELSPLGTPVGASPYLSGSSVAFDQPWSVVPDTLGNIWITSHSSSSSIGNRLVEFNPTTKAATSYTGLPTGCSPYALAIDGKDNVFFACPALGYLYEYPNLTSGTPSTTNLPTYSSSPTQLGLLGASTATYSTPETYGLAIDDLSDVWAANTVSNVNTKTVTEYATGAYTTVANTYNPGSGPNGIAADSSNNVWAIASGTLDEFIYGAGGAGGYTTNSFTGAGLNSGKGLAIDGSGNIWVANGTLPVISGTSYLTLSQFNSSGLPITQGVTTLQPGGLAVATTVTDASPRGLTIDPSGNVWIAGCGNSTSCSSGATSFVTEFIGVANPPVVPLASAIASSQLGCCTFTPVAPTGTTATDTAGYVTLQASSLAATQDNGTISFEVTRAGGFKGALNVTYTLTNGTAHSGTDYSCATCASGTTGTLTWADGDTSYKTITVNWLPTTTYSGTRTFNISLSCSTACPVGFSPNQSELVTMTDNLTPPSTRFNFNGSTISYYLGLPVDPYLGTGGVNGAQFAEQNIQSATLASGYSSPYFYLNSSNQIVFTAPSNGATSSPGVGTNDTRSEMREQYAGTGASNGNTNWDSTIGGTLTATCAVNATSVDTYEATIGQIHGENQPFALLQYQPTSSTQGNIVLAVVNTNTTNAASTSYTLATGISLNTFFSYSLNLSKNTGILSASVNGGTATTVSVDSSWLGNGNSNNAYGMYFKFGAYSGAPNTGNPTADQTQVTFSTFNITHP